MSIGSNFMKSMSFRNKKFYLLKFIQQLFLQQQDLN